MAKYYNNIKKTGRVGGSVFSIRAGETIERAYNPVVFNPNTDAQIAARARLKLMSQLAAVAAPAIAIPRSGSRSTRNLFVSKNYAMSSYASREATIDVASLQLTDSTVALPRIGAERRSSGNIAAYIADAANVGVIDIDRLVYVLLSRAPDGRLRYVSSLVATEAGGDNAWQVEFSAVSGLVYVLAYGIRDNTNAASVAFGNLTIPTAETIAHLIVTKTLLDGDVTLTETRGMALQQA